MISFQLTIFYSKHKDKTTSLHIIFLPNLLSSPSPMATTLPSHTPLSITTLTTSHSPHTKFFFFPKYPSRLLTKPISLTLCTKKDDFDITIFNSNEFDSDEPLAYDLPEKPDGFLPPRVVDEPPFETEDEVTIAFEELYGPAYSGESLLGKDVNVMDSKFKKSFGFGSKIKKERIRDGFDEKVVQIRRVTKVVKGGKQLKFRAVVIVGNKKGKVGVGCAQAREVVSAVQKAAADARRNIVTVPMTKYLTFPHRMESNYGAATVMLRPAAPGSGVIAGGAVRTVLEMAGVANALGKQLRSKNPLNNARATIVAVTSMRQFSDVARERGIPMEELWK